MKANTLLASAIVLTALSLHAEYAWQKPNARVLPEGELALAQEPFAAPQMQNPRYIDFEKGDDAKDGRTPATAWKHHPLDREAAGAAKANEGHPDGYVFKGGVAYRGTLKGKLDGSSEHPVHLTTLPSWGKGKALISGSDVVPARKWRKAAHPRMPEGGKVWAADLDFSPRAVFFRAPNGGSAKPLHIARMPNWEVSNPEDPRSEWWTWEQPNWWEGRNKDTVNGKRMHRGVDGQHLHGIAPEDLVGGLVWSEWGIVMGQPYASLIEAANPGSINFQGFWNGDSEKIITGNRYYLEDRPAFLDAPGEFWFDRKGDGTGTLYLRLPGDADPTTCTVEAARRSYLIDLASASNVRISNLGFAFTNPYWHLEAPFFQNDDVLGAAIRVMGGNGSVAVDHCDFSDLNQAIRLKAGAADFLPLVAFNDNRIQRTAHTAIGIEGELLSGDGTARHNTLGHVDVLRNSLREIGDRGSRFTFTHALCVNWPETLHLAGNILNRTYGAGLFIFMGKPDGDDKHTVPFSRAVIHHNRVESALLGNNDWGSIETWQGGVFYVYDNISANPNGYWNWAAKHTDGTDRLGFAYYLDGSFKNYLFNNIALGFNNDLTSPLCNNAAFYQAVPSIYNQFFNNTAHRFAVGSNWSPAGGRQIFAGNVFNDISKLVFGHGPQKEDTDENKADMPMFDTIGYARNVFAKTPPASFGALEKGGDPGTLTFERFRAAAKASGTFASDLGTITGESVFAEGSLVPLAGSAAIDAGVRPFIPWNLSRTVGEWNFRGGKGLDEHWFMTPAYAHRSTYYKVPRNDLVLPEGTVATAGFTEDWVDTAVRFDGGPATLAAPATPFVLPASAPQKADDGLQHFDPKPWLHVSCPRDIQPGKKLEVGVDIQGAPANAADKKIAFHLHWMKKDGWGGYLAHQFVPTDFHGDGRYKVAVDVPANLPDAFDSYNFMVSLSDDAQPSSDKALAANFNVRPLHGAAVVSATATCGDKPQSVGSASLIVEAVFAAPAPGGAIASCVKDGVGYALGLNDQGALAFRFGAKGANAPATVATSASVADGKPHHALAEVDREAGRVTLYVDGKTAATAPLPAALKEADATVDAPLAVGADFQGELDYLRIALSSLAESRTTLDELYTWQFDGPFLRDFTGRKPNGRRDAGALER